MGRLHLGSRADVYLAQGIKDAEKDCMFTLSRLRHSARKHIPELGENVLAAVDY